MFKFNIHDEQQDRLGAVMVEFALVSPFFFLILFACLEFARMSMIRNSVENIVYEGARAGIVPGATEAKIKEKIMPLIKAIGIVDAELEVTPETIYPSTETVTVSAKVCLYKNSWVMGSFTPTRYLTKAITMTRERTSLNRSSISTAKFAEEADLVIQSVSDK